MGLGQRPRPMRRIRQVIERSEHQHRVEAVVLMRKIAGVALLGREPSGTGALDVSRHEVHDLDPMAVALEPLGVDAIGAADIEDLRGGSERATQDLLGPKELDPAFSGFPRQRTVRTRQANASLSAEGLRKQARDTPIVCPVSTTSAQMSPAGFMSAARHRSWDRA